MKWALRRLIKDGESSYNEIRPILGLPSARHLKEYKNAFKDDGQGVQETLLRELDEQCKRRKTTQWQRHGCLKWDALKSSEGLTSNVFTGELVGIEFEGVDSFEHLSHSLKKMDDEPDDEPTHASAKLAKYWTEVMFTSAGMANFTYSIYRMGSSELSAHDIAAMVHTCLVACYKWNFHVIALVCDGASEHRAFMKHFGTITVADVEAFIEFGVLDASMYDDDGPCPDQPTAGTPPPFSDFGVRVFF